MNDEKRTIVEDLRKKRGGCCMETEGFAISILYPIMKAMARKGLDFQHFCRAASFDAGTISSSA
ncbi:MAG: hypothetical protein E7L01_13210 [Paenibacillus macerans]|uniref:Uncharacterized protein n=2 Tax=Paenibacillus macerans TaxID=44252 RepID=A0A6N8EZ51_PAEMA|nr:hypothetical protein [Paenibacillus macerans]MBS5914196.1 hypothetical protein [Paenibacillus macerans]MCY7558777.1 hypothetical protein [Paenibacillus macerans]MDU5946380.1 hypothetical protein [Paenibacillus macerans]MDU7474275.1 hypothetical protein [Paenibacillus macerans]MEC0139569.1 hypothetical protein [Paenibacillus macerans]